jgi:DNA-binding NarL/FixJ family response regulator
VLVVDDQELVRSGIVALLSKDESVRVVGARTCGEEALDDLDALKPDVVLLDHRLPGISGSATCTKILERDPDVAVVILTTEFEDDIIYACLTAGARGFLLKDTSSADLVAAVRSAARGESVLAPIVMEKVVEWARGAKTLSREEDDLDALEVTILELVSEGLSNPAIGKRLRISSQSVKLKLRSIMAKLGVTRRSEAVAVGIRRGII